MPSFPLSLPSYTGIENIRFIFQAAVGMTRSPFTLQSQVQRHPGELWTAELSFKPMPRADAEELIARLTQLQGMYETILLGPVGNSATPRGVATGTPLVNGATQTGFTLITNGWTPTITGILLKGDWFAVGGYLYKLTENANSNGSGEATLEFSTRLRASPADNAAITTLSPRGKFRLQDNEYGYSEDVNDATLIRLDDVKAIEAI